MRRIYESRALEYDEEDPHKPNRKGSDRDGDRGSRTINWEAASHALVPRRLRALALGVEVETDSDVYGPEEPVNFRVTFRNRVPFPIWLETTSPVRWSWSIDGLEEASRLANHPDDGGVFRFGRGERKRFRRRWPQRFRESHGTWRPAERGEHTLAVRINAPDADARGLRAETTFRIE
jgi:hypothetical protein